VFVCRPCSRCSGPVDRSVGYPTTGLWVWDAAGGAGGWAPYCVLGVAVGRRVVSLKRDGPTGQTTGQRGSDPYFVMCAFFELLWKYVSRKFI